MSGIMTPWKVASVKGNAGNYAHQQCLLSAPWVNRLPPLLINSLTPLLELVQVGSCICVRGVLAGGVVVHSDCCVWGWLSPAPLFSWKDGEDHGGASNKNTTQHWWTKQWRDGRTDKHKWVEVLSLADVVTLRATDVAWAVPTPGLSTRRTTKLLLCERVFCVFRL